MQTYRLVSVALGVTLAVAALLLFKPSAGARGAQPAEPRRLRLSRWSGFPTAGCAGTYSGRLGNTGPRGLVPKSRWHVHDPGRLQESKSKPGT